ncbi:hypothetical protein ABZU32_23770 [Sphaerisporangium sp. NPDC005288]|uniref:hypothetical protein n=1 Tax=Sphaerisporangium sp. NPDC005288 TaxID=3155114 RepID=UPI0033A47F2E
MTIREPGYGLPSLGEVVDLLTTLNDLIRVINIAHAVREASRAPRFGPTERVVGTPPAPGEGVNSLAEERVKLRQIKAMVRDEASHENSAILDRISMNSPLSLEVLLPGAGGTAVAGMVVYIFKNPDKIGEWFPKLQAAWYNGQVEAEKARQKVEKLRKARTEMRELQS